MRGIILICLAFLLLRIDWSPSTGLEDGGRDIWIIDYGWHTGIAMRTGDLAAANHPVLNTVAQRIGAGTWIEFGWGDKGFYTNTATGAGIDAGLAARALLWPTPSVMQAGTGYGEIEDAFINVDVLHIQIADESFDTLLNGIAQGFAGTDIIGQGVYPGAYFFEGRHSYHAAFTCNSWIAARLREAGISASPLLALHSKTLLMELKWRQYFVG